MAFQEVIKNIANALKVWQMRNHSFISWSSAFSKIVYLTFLTLLPNKIIKELKHIQKKILWSNKKVKVKSDTLCNSYRDWRFQEC